jgi:undecaprenyl-diphosphatase
MNSLLALDRAALVWINSHHHPILDAILLPITYAGEVAALWFLICLGMLIFGRKEHRRTAIILAVTIIAVDRLIAAQLGHLLPRERPYLAIEGIRQVGIRWAGGSFPSGHAHSVWIATIILGSRWRKLILPLVVFALLTCYSRPYFGMHYPGDVLGGSIIGLGAGFGVLAISRKHRRKKDGACIAVEKEAVQ